MDKLRDALLQPAKAQKFIKENDIAFDFGITGNRITADVVPNINVHLSVLANLTLTPHVHVVYDLSFQQVDGVPGVVFTPVSIEADLGLKNHNAGVDEVIKAYLLSTLALTYTAAFLWIVWQLLRFLFGVVHCAAIAPFEESLGRGEGLTPKSLTDAYKD